MMRSHNTLWSSLLLLWASQTIGAADILNYPPAKIDPVTETHFGTPVKDPYRWLENSRSQDVQTWVQSQDRLAQAHLMAFKGRAALARRLRELYDVDKISLPEKEGPRLFFTHRLIHQDKAALYFREGAQGKDHLLLNPNGMLPKGRISLGEFFPSPDGSKLAYTLKVNNADAAVLHVRDINTGVENPLDIIPGADNIDLAWTPDSPVFYYTSLPENPSLPSAERAAYATVRYHVLGTDSRQDPEVYPKTGDALLYLTPHVSRDGRWLFVTVARGWTSNAIYVRDRQGPTGPFQPLFTSTCATASVIAWKDTFYLTTNQDAPNSKIMRVDAEHAVPELWKTLVPERKDTLIESAHILGEHLVLKVLKNLSSRIEVYSLDGELLHQVDLPEVGTVRDLSGHEADDIAYFEFESFFIPPRIYKFSVASGQRSLWAQTQVPVNPALYQMELARFHSKDGTEVSMFIVQRKNSPHDGSTPFQLQGYGGFQTAMVPQFSAAIYPWLEAGGGVAVPHLRGGGEYGEAWHRAGMLTQKQHTFDDMIAAAEYLTDHGYTQRDLLALQGASNGGLLAGAMITQRPDLFRAVVCKNPLLDMIRYPSFGIGKAWIPEYGSPEREDEFRALAAYSPYHHVKEKTRYPAVLLMSSEYDDRVDPMHARKMAASLQASSVSGYPIFYRLIPSSGHGGADRIHDEIEETADRLGFLLSEIGVRGTWPGVE